MPNRPITTWTILLALLPMVAASATLAADDRKLPKDFEKYETPFYTMFTDLRDDDVREAAIRLTCMAEEYRDRTSSFQGKGPKRMPFYLFSDPKDYARVSGVPGSAGVYIHGRALMATAGRGNVWHVVQHEGFHQYVDQAIGGDFPIWVNEGLAEYFGSGVWTGDRLLTGVIPRARLRGVKGLIKVDKLLDFEDMLTMSHQEWNAAMSGKNYLQAWSMVHFLVHGDNAKYRGSFTKFLSDLSRGRNWKRSWAKRMGRDVSGFEKRHAKWWSSLGSHPTRDLYDQAVVETLTSYLARATKLDLDPNDTASFLDDVAAGKVQVDPKKDPWLWLPVSLGKQAVRDAKRLGDVELAIPDRGFPKLVVTRKDGTTFRGSFTLPRKARPEIKVSVTPGKGQADEEADAPEDKSDAADAKDSGEDNQAGIQSREHSSQIVLTTVSVPGL